MAQSNLAFVAFVFSHKVEVVVGTGGDFRGFLKDLP